MVIIVDDEAKEEMREKREERELKPEVIMRNGIKCTINRSRRRKEGLYEYNVEFTMPPKDGNSYGSYIGGFSMNAANKNALMDKINEGFKRAKELAQKKTYKVGKYTFNIGNRGSIIENSIKRDGKEFDISVSHADYNTEPRDFNPLFEDPAEKYKKYFESVEKNYQKYLKASDKVFEHKGFKLTLKKRAASKYDEGVLYDYKLEYKEKEIKGMSSLHEKEEAKFKKAVDEYIKEMDSLMTPQQFLDQFKVIVKDVNEDKKLLQKKDTGEFFITDYDSFNTQRGWNERDESNEKQRSIFRPEGPKKVDKWYDTWEYAHIAKINFNPETYKYSTPDYYTTYRTVDDVRNGKTKMDKHGTSDWKVKIGSVNRLMKPYIKSLKQTPEAKAREKAKKQAEKEAKEKEMRKRALEEEIRLKQEQLKSL